MSVPIETIAPGRCFRANDQKLRKILLTREKSVIYILHEHLAWTVQRFFETAESFAEACEAEIDCANCHACSA
jgi:hypothetical protein